ncbi:hypothetical protein CGCF413_v013453 [Colletotrichum fructicola]|nr:hypothetical protein CGCF413_v013453 [Colletotrichum fructicola]
MLRYNTASRPAGRRTQPDHEDEAQRLLEHIQEGNVGIDEMLEGATKEGRRFEVNATEEFVDHITAFNLGQEHADTVERKAATKIATHGVGEGDSDLASHDMICQSLLNLHEHLQKLQKKEGKDCNVKHHVMLRMTGFNDLSAAETIKTIPFEILVSPCQPVARRGRTAAWQAATVKFDDKAGSAWQESICGLNNLGYLNGHIPNLVFNRNQLSLSHIQLSQGSLPPLNDEHISLRNLLGRKHDSTETGNNLMAFSKQDRGLLTLNLARSLFYLFDGPWSWGTQRCTADEFIFLGKVRSPRIFLHGCHKPYIHSNLSNPWKLRCQKAEDKRRSDRPSYQMFFGLAQILMEIHLGHSLDLDDSRPGGFRASLKEIAQNELKDPENSAYKEAILGCLDLSFNLLSVDDDQLSTKEKQLIHDNVIANLKENCKLWDFSRPEDIEFDTKLRDVPEKKPSGYNTPGAPGGAADAKSLAFGKDVEDSRIRRLPPGLSVFKLYDDTDHSSQSTKDAAREFLELIKIINEQYVKPCEEIETPRRKVRIAILDSGVSRKDTLIKGAFQAGIIQGVWGPGGTDRKDYDDTYGHGTHVARLLLETAPLAELYIAKVCDDKFLDENKLDNIVRAFEWALDDAIDVDIISISFGMQRNIPEIEAVVEKALEQPLNKTSRLDIAPEDIYKHCSSGFTTTRSELLSGSYGLWAKFIGIEGIGGELSVSRETNNEDTYRFESLEEFTFTAELDYVTKSMNQRSVKEFLEITRHKKPVYMITGIKVARKPSVSFSRNRETGATFELGLSQPGGIPLELGPKIEHTRGTGILTEYQSADDFIFGIRVKRLRFKRRLLSGKSGDLVADHYHRGAMLVDNGKILIHEDLAPVESDDEAEDTIEMRGKSRIEDGDEVWIVPQRYPASA